MSYRVTTYKEAFEGLLGVPYNEKLQRFTKRLEEEGHTEKSIAFSIWKTRYDLVQYKNDSRFLAVVRNNVKKYSWTKDDPRWDEYWKRKKEEERARKTRKAIEAYYNDAMNDPKLKQKAFNKKAKSEGYVYFIQGMYGGAVKIGFSKVPERRLRELQTGYPDTLRILLLIPGNEKTEKYFQREFELYKLNGEWFKPEKVLMDRIKELQEEYQQERLC